jgi:hypothetical protein
MANDYKDYHQRLRQFLNNSLNLEKAVRPRKARKTRNKCICIKFQEIWSRDFSRAWNNATIISATKVAVPFILRG